MLNASGTSIKKLKRWHKITSLYCFLKLHISNLAGGTKGFLTLDFFSILTRNAIYKSSASKYNSSEQLFFSKMSLRKYLGKFKCLINLP